MSKLSFFSTLPLTPNERAYGAFAFTCVSFSVVVATWSFLIGGVIGDFVNASMAIGVITFGYLSTFCLLALSLMMCFWYGIDPYIAARPIFGRKGASIILILAIVVAEGWIALVAVMFGSAITNIFSTILPEWTGTVSGAIYVLSNLFFIFIVWLITWKGPIVVRYTNLFIAPAVLIMLVIMTILILKSVSWAEFVRMPPKNPFEWFQRDNITAIELVFGVTWSWWPYAGVWMRLAKTSKIAYHGTVWGSGIGFAVATLLATFSALWVGEIDPTKWMVIVGGVTFGVFGLIFIAMANIMSDVGQLYPVCLASQNWSFFRKMKWSLLVFIWLIPITLVAWVDSETLFAKTGTLMILCGVLFCPAAAIYITDFWLLRKKRLDLKEIYNDKPEGKYFYYKGYNPAAIIAFGLGFFIYLLFLNPISLESVLEPIFIWTAATPPVLLITGVTYYFLTKYWIIPRKMGGYNE
jgi:nucleobase:cation symporter-1, NCS1 family